MALDRSDIELLKGAKEKGLTIDQMIASAEQLLALNELKQKLNNIGNELSFKFSQIVERDIEKIASLKTDNEKLGYIVKEAYKMYTDEIKTMEEENRIREEAEEKRDVESEEETTEE